MISLEDEFDRVVGEFLDFYIDTMEHVCSIHNRNGHDIAVPVYDETKWAVNEGRNNCYNFALDYQDNSELQPGALYLRTLSFEEKAKELRKWAVSKDIVKPLKEYTNAIIERAESDGLHYLGMKPQPLKDAFPVALFIRRKHGWTNDFHWFALRRKANAVFADEVGWFDKGGPTPVRACDKETIFHLADAKEDGYNYFAGYFAVNKDNLKIPGGRRGPVII